MSGPTPSLRANKALALAAVLPAAAWFAVRLAAIGGGSDRLPRWDEARHGLDAVRLADAVRGLDPAEFLRHLWNMAYWPPAYPLLQLPAALLLGSDYAVLRVFMGGVFGALLLAVFAAGVSLGGRRGVWAGLLAVALVSSSPFLQHYGTVIMLELPGALLTVVAFWTYALYRAGGSVRRLRWACAATLALFFCKYNFGILWMASVALLEAGEARAWTRLPRAADALRRASRAARFLIAFLAIYTGFLLAILLTGGWDWHIAGARISVHKLGNPVSLLALILVAVFLAHPRRNAARVRAASGALPARIRTYARLVLAPVIVWLLLPPHTAAFFNFVQNRPAERPWIEDLLWYPRDFLDLYSPSPALGVAVLVGALLPILWIRRQDPRERILTVAAVVGFAVPTLHHLKEARFLLVVTPLLWLSFARLAANGIEHALRQARWRGRLAAGIPALTVTASLAVLCAVQPMRLDSARVRQAFREFTLPPSIQPVLDAVRTASVDGEATVVLGLWDRFSPNLLEWDARLHAPELGEDRLARGPRRRARLGAPERLLDALDRERVGTVLVLELEGEPDFAPVHRWELDWLPEVADRLEADPRFRFVREVRFPEAGYALREFRRP